MPRFGMGRLVATPGALRLFTELGLSGSEYLARHMRGDWGDLDDHDKRANNRAVKDGARILSAYRVGDQRIYIITEADRSATTILLPEEY